MQNQSNIVAFQIVKDELHMVEQSCGNKKWMSVSCKGLFVKLILRYRLY